MPRQRVVQRFQVGRSIVEQRLTSCGKKNCGKCPHGPYWYELFTGKNGMQVKKYLGKKLPEKMRTLLTSTMSTPPLPLDASAWKGNGQKP